MDKKTLAFFDDLSKECIDFTDEYANFSLSPSPLSSILFKKMRKLSEQSKNFVYPKLVNPGKKIVKKIFGGEKSKPSLLMEHFPLIKKKMLENLEEIAFALNNVCIEKAENFIQKKINELNKAFQENDDVEFASIYDELPITVVDYYVSYLMKKTEIKEFYQCFVPMRTQKLIEKTEVYPIEIKAENIHLRVLDKNSPKINMHVRLLSDVMLWMCDIVDGSRKCEKNLSVIDFNEDPKLFPEKKGKPLGRVEINSGYTSFDTKGNAKSIIIFRYEELVKVLIHELIHTFRVDKNLYTNSDVKNYVEQRFPMITHYEFECEHKHNILLGEAYVESLAHIFYCIFLSKFLQKRNLFNYFMEYTIKWSLIQTAKILEHYSVSNFDDFFNSFVEEHTNTTAYYVIRSAILFNINKFYDFLLSINGTEKSIKDFLYIAPKNVIPFLKFIDECLKNKDFKEKIKEIINKIKEKKKNTLIWRTLRASPFVIYFEPYKTMYF